MTVRNRDDRARDPERAGRCVTDHCVTCSDEGIPMRVVSEEREGIATCEDQAGGRQHVQVDLVGPVRKGETLLVHAGTALLRLDVEGPP